MQHTCAQQRWWRETMGMGGARVYASALQGVAPGRVCGSRVARVRRVRARTNGAWTRTEEVGNLHPHVMVRQEVVLVDELAAVERREQVDDLVVARPHRGRPPLAVSRRQRLEVSPYLVALRELVFGELLGGRILRRSARARKEQRETQRPGAPCVVGGRCGMLRGAT